MRGQYTNTSELKRNRSTSGTLRGTFADVWPLQCLVWTAFERERCSILVAEDQRCGSGKWMKCKDRRWEGRVWDMERLVGTKGLCGKGW